jgi:hypothetical protein
MLCKLYIDLYSVEICKKVVASYIRLACRTFCVTVSRYLKEFEKLIAFAYDKFSCESVPTLPINVQLSCVRSIQAEVLCNTKNRSSNSEGRVRSRYLEDPTLFFLALRNFLSVLLMRILLRMCLLYNVHEPCDFTPCWYIEIV